MSHDHHHHHHQHPPGVAHPPAVVAASNSSAVGGGAARYRFGADRGDLGRRFLGDERMTAQLSFRDLTLGYDRHPAVHHLSGEVPSGALLAVVGPNGAGKSTLFKGIVGAIRPLSGHVDLSGAVGARHRLSAAGRRDRPQLPDQRLRSRGDGAVAQDRVVRRHRQGRSRQDREGASARWGSPASSGAPSARCRAGRCSACCSRGCCCRMRSSWCWTSRSTRSMPAMRCAAWFPLVLLASIALNGSSSTTSRASCNNSRANSMRCI